MLFLIQFLVWRTRVKTYLVTLIFYTFIKVEYQQNSDIINDVIDYILCCVLSNELFINIILLLLVHGKIIKTKCACKHYVKWTLDTKLLLQNFLTIVFGLNNPNSMC